MSETTCPICEAGVPANAPACGTCGFPSELRVDALRALVEPEASPGSAADAQTHPERERPRGPRIRPAPDGVEALAGELAQGIAGLRKQGKDVAPYVAELQRAALDQVEGRSAEAIALLRAAIGRLSGESKENTEASLAALEKRHESLERSGVKDGLTPAIERVRRSIQSGLFAEAADILGAADVQARRLEDLVHEFRSTLAAIEELWGAGVTASLPPTGLEPRVASIRRYLSDSTHTAEALASVAVSAQELLGLLRNELTSSFTAELARNAEALGLYPVDDPGALAARRRNAEAATRTRDGRFIDAAALIDALRRATEALPPPSEAQEASRAASAERSASVRGARARDVTSASVIEKARLLATCVRALPAGSPMATEAAQEIRRATELLKDRKLQEAHEVLVRLMGILDMAAPGVEEAGAA